MVELSAGIKVENIDRSQQTWVVHPLSNTQSFFDSGVSVATQLSFEEPYTILSDVRS